MPGDLLLRWHEIFKALTTKIEVDIEVDFPRDRKDAKFLECALVSEADYLITGDKDFFEAQKIMRTTIISVSLFKKLVSGAW